MLLVIFIGLVLVHIKLRIIEKSFDFNKYTFFNQLEALVMAIDTFVDYTNTIEEFNLKYKEVLEANFRQLNH
jgi:hypothetical protein